MLQPTIWMQKNPTIELNNIYLINYGLFCCRIQKQGSTSNKHSLASKKSWLPLPIKSSQADLLANLAVHKFSDAGRSTASLKTALSFVPTCGRASSVQKLMYCQISQEIGPAAFYWKRQPYFFGRQAVLIGCAALLLDAAAIISLFHYWFQK